MQEYYRWKQWSFVKMYERGLAYKKTLVCQLVPARARPCSPTSRWRTVSAGAASTVVTHKELEQWFFKITAYAEELLDHTCDKLTGLARAGAHDAAELDRQVPRVWRWTSPSRAPDEKLTIFTTRPDTLFGVTFMCIAPEHPMALDLLITGTGGGRRSSVC